MFEVSIKRLIWLLMPTFLRRATLFAWLQALTAPVVTIYNGSMTARRDALYCLRITGQRCYLRRALKDAFRGYTFRIEDNPAMGQWVYAWDENMTSQLMVPDEPGAVLVWDEDFISSDNSSFIVYVPMALRNSDNEARIKSILNTYKLVSRKYRIVYE